MAMMMSVLGEDNSVLEKSIDLFAHLFSVEKKSTWKVVAYKVESSSKLLIL